VQIGGAAIVAASHAAVTLDANADTLLSLSTQALGLDTQAKNRIFAGPGTGVDAAPTFRALVSDDIPTLDHGAKLTGLTDDDHTQYLLATGARTGASAQAQTFTNGIIGPSWKPASNSTTALQLQNASGTAIVTVDTTNNALKLVGPHTAPPFLTIDHTGGTAVAGWKLLSDGTEVVVNTYNSATGEHKSGGIQSYVFSTFYAGNAERLRITTDGKVGIGTNAPGVLLDVRGDAIFKSNSTTALQLQNATGTAIVTVDTTNNALKLVGPHTAPPFLTIDHTGGTTVAGWKLLAGGTEVVVNRRTQKRRHPKLCIRDVLCGQCRMDAYWD
jgi:hypothetical protein